MDDFPRVVQETSGGLLTVPNADGRSGSSKILWLRPNQGLPLTDEKPDDNQGHSSEMRLLNVGTDVHIYVE